SNLMPRMAKPLVIVESPAKARTIARFLGGDFVVESSVGHIRDLPRNAADVPASHKGEPWARLGVDIDNGFKPLYVVAKEKKHVVTDLKQKLKQASELYLATDEDREGESIAWHLLEVLSPPEQMPVRRMVFHEITAGASRGGPGTLERMARAPQPWSRSTADVWWRAKTSARTGGCHATTWCASTRPSPVRSRAGSAMHPSRCDRWRRSRTGAHRRRRS